MSPYTTQGASGTAVGTGLTSGTSDTNATPTTASVTFSQSGLRFIWVTVEGLAAPPDTVDASISGCGLTWSKVDEYIPVTFRRMMLFQGTGTPTTGSLTITETGTTVNPPNQSPRISWGVFEITGANGIVQHVPGEGGTGTSRAITLSAFAEPTNACLAVWGQISSDGSVQPESGFTLLLQLSTNNSILVEFRNSDADITPGATQSSNWFLAGIALEIRTERNTPQPLWTPVGAIVRSTVR